MASRPFDLTRLRLDPEENSVVFGVLTCSGGNPVIVRAGVRPVSASIAGGERLLSPSS